jgi:hypothetical protein
MNLTIPPESALLIGIGAFNAVRPIFVAFSILMLDWGERGPNRLRVFQSFNGKTLLRNPIDSEARNGGKGCGRPSKKERARGGMRRNIRKGDRC